MQKVGHHITLRQVFIEGDFNAGILGDNTFTQFL